MKTTFKLTLDDMALIAKRHGRRCDCDVCESYALEMRKRHSQEQDMLIAQLAERHGVSVETAHDWLYRGKVGRKARPTRYQRRKRILTADDVERSTPPRPTGNPNWTSRAPVVGTNDVPQPPHGNDK